MSSTPAAAAPADEVWHLVIRAHETLEVGAGQALRSTFTKRERLTSSVTALVICWAIAAFCLLIPILHFFLVPIFFITGPILFFLSYTQKAGFKAGHGLCPVCKKDFKIVAMRETWPWRDVCEHCRTNVTIERRV